MLSDITSGCKKICLASTEFFFLYRIYKLKKNLPFIKLPTSMISFVWLSSFTWVALASSYSLNCTYHCSLFTSRWRAKCCILIVVHLFMNISYGAYCMLCCTEMPLFNIHLWIDYFAIMMIHLQPSKLKPFKGCVKFCLQLYCSDASNFYIW